jgi:hypothetical protein
MEPLRLGSNSFQALLYSASESTSGAEEGVGAALGATGCPVIIATNSGDLISRNSRKWGIYEACGDEIQTLKIDGTVAVSVDFIDYLLHFGLSGFLPGCFHCFCEFFDADAPWSQESIWMFFPTIDEFRLTSFVRVLQSSQRLSFGKDHFYLHIHQTHPSRFEVPLQIVV